MCRSTSTRWSIRARCICAFRNTSSCNSGWKLEKREATVASGAKLLAPYVGPLRTSFGNRSCFTGAMVLDSEVLLGEILMEDMDLVVRPATRDVGPNPANPNIPASFAMGVLQEGRGDAGRKG